MALRKSLLAVLLSCTMFTSVALAQDADESGEPVLLSADQVTFDETLGVVTASGNVELAQGARILLADTVSYNQRTNVVTASGNLRLLEPSGEVIFADYAELTDDLKQGFVDNIRLLLTDNSRLAANEGERTDDGRYTRMQRAVYSPCNLCEEDPTRPPLWQIKAVRVIHDKERRDVVYRDASLEFFGVPVAYTPYFSHPDPTVDRRSGFLTPSFGFSSDLGAFFRNYYYLDIAPDKDATIEATLSEEDALLLGGEWRQRFENGRLQLSGSVVRADRVEGSGRNEVTRENRLRGHIFGDGLFNIDDTWRWGFSLARASDDTYLRRYDYSDEDILTNRAFVEGFRGRHYASVNAYGFQDLRPGNDEEEPIVLPLANVSALGEPGALFGGRWSLDAGLLALTRDTGTDTRRLTSQVGWERDFFADAGFITTVSTGLRSDFWYTDDLVRSGTGEAVDETATRFFPEAQVLVRYPLARQIGTVHQYVEPLAAVRVAPQVDNDDAIPNEDSTDLEFDDTNLFRSNRFSGVDRIEGGSRLTYGLRSGLFGFGGGSTTLFVGQSYRFSDDDAYPAGSGLEDRFSDIVGRLQITPNALLDLNYGFRLDKDSLEPRRHDVTASAGPSVFRVSANYLYIDQTLDPDPVARTEREELTVGLSSAFATYWSAGIFHRRDLSEDGGSLRTGLRLTYRDECFTFSVNAARNFTTRTGVESGDSIFFRIAFRNLGEFTTPAITPELFRGSTSDS